MTEHFGIIRVVFESVERKNEEGKTLVHVRRIWLSKKVTTKTNSTVIIKLIERNRNKSITTDVAVKEAK